MKVIHTIAELRESLDPARAMGRSVGFAPTMGALHRGHESLMVAASTMCNIGVASIFVNPLQFAPDEDIDSYPRTLDEDSAMAEASGISYLFVPTVREMYPVENWTTVSLRVVTEPWEGSSRPTHFAGVATVVTKLLNIVGPCTGYFGQKDFQQLAMLRRMVSDLNMPMTVKGMPTVREEDGLAMSSRNLRLTPEHRAQAPTVQRALRAGVAAVESGERDPAAIEAVIRAMLATAPDAEEPDYIAVVDADSLRTPNVLDGQIRLLTAVKFGDVRLIDNLGVVAT
jgi:pantoate--beta-alanine ligase